MAAADTYRLSLRKGYRNYAVFDFHDLIKNALLRDEILCMRVDNMLNEYSFMKPFMLFEENTRYWKMAEITLHSKNYIQEKCWEKSK